MEPLGCLLVNGELLMLAQHLPHRRRLVAATLIGMGCIEIVAMLFHPTAGPTSSDSLLLALADISQASSHVHMAMIAAVVAIWSALSYHSREWPSRGWGWLADRLYGLGAVAMIGAALVNGFVVGGFAERALDANEVDQFAALYSILFSFSLNQVLAGFGTILMSAGIVAWSIGLWPDARRLPRIASAYGAVAGTACVLAYAIGALQLDVFGMGAVVVAHGLWYVLIGISIAAVRV